MKNALAYFFPTTETTNRLFYSVDTWPTICPQAKSADLGRKSSPAGSMTKLKSWPPELILALSYKTIQLIID